ARFVVAEVKRMELPEIDDDLALAYDFDDLGTLEARIREDVNARHEQSADLEVEEEILDGLLGRCEIPLPEDGLEKAIEGSLREAIIERIYSGSFDANEQSIEQLREELAGETRTRVERSMRLWYLIEKIAKAEKIFATENDYEARIVAMARARNTTPTKIREQIAEKEAENDIRASILESKVRKWLTDKAEIAEESVDGPASKGDEAAEGSES
ncbi:MAG: hypothetical protein KDB53_07865, partial [Planctomycetes bacterium]|nr:hypothetical protein [Planctomycetota bacterium]